MNSYELSRSLFDFSFENPDKVRPVHIALYFFAIEHCNRLGWKEKFGLPTSMAMEAIGVKSANTYCSTLKDLVEWGFIRMVEKSKNQYSANVVAISKNDTALYKALDKALIKHGTKQGYSTDSIDKQLNKEQENKEQGQSPTPTVTDSLLIDRDPTPPEPEHPLVAWCKKETPTVMKMKTPLSNAEAGKLITAYGNTEVAAVLRAMENKPKLTTDYKSAYLTAVNWLDKRRENGPKQEAQKPALTLQEKLKLQSERTYD